jgi:hypothetical protein
MSHNAIYCDDSKSYASEARLLAALEHNGLHDCRPLIVRNRAGRWTAVFSATFLRAISRPIIKAARAGFKTLD